METRTSFWFEVRRAIQQWVGIASSAVLAGTLALVLVHYGINERVALGISLSVGALFALVFWIEIGRSFSATRKVPTIVQRTEICATYSFEDGRSVYTGTSTELTTSLK